MFAEVQFMLHFIHVRLQLSVSKTGKNQIKSSQ